jgi:hypothetical protein
MAGRPMVRHLCSLDKEMMNSIFMPYHQMAGKEVRLTTAKGLDDGSEYSPDGKQFISIQTVPVK